MPVERIAVERKISFFLSLYVDGLVFGGIEAASPRRSGLGGFKSFC